MLTGQIKTAQRSIETESIAKCLSNYRDNPSANNLQKAKMAIKTIEDLRTMIDGKTVLWHLAEAAVHQKPEPFNYFWKKFKNQIELDDLFFAPAQGVNAFTHVFFAAWLGETNAFFSIWEKFYACMPINVLTDQFSFVVEGSANCYSILQLLFSYNEAPQFKTMVQNPFGITFQYVTISVLRQVPGRIQLELPTSNPHAKTLSARNALMDSLENPDDDASIWKNATKADQLGYVNAFYETAQFYEAKQNLDWAASAYARVPETSRYYKTSNIFLMHHYLRCAKNVTSNAVSRHASVEGALTAYFKIKQSDASFLKEIAYCYIYEGQEPPADSINWDVLLQFITPQCSVKMCIQMFDKIKEANHAIQCQITEKTPAILYGLESKKMQREDPVVFDPWVESFFSPM